MTPQQAAAATLSYFHTSGVLTFWVRPGGFLYSSTDDRYRYDVTDPAALEILAECYAARQTKPEVTP